MPRTYDGSQVAAIIDGESIEGRAESDFLTLEWAADLAQITPGMDGDFTIDLLNNFTGTATIVVPKGSRGSVLLDKYRQRMMRKEGSITFSFGARYIPTGEQWVSQIAVLITPAPITFGSEAGTEEWVIGLGKIEGDRFALPA